MLSLSVISPEKTVLETQSTSVTVPTSTGLITILPSHAPLFSILQKGEVIVRAQDQQPTSIVVSDGFIGVYNNKVTLLTEFGIHSDELNEAVILEAKERAEKTMAERKDEQEYAKAEAELMKALLQLKFVTRKKNPS
ncbi:ATP synthase F1 subunit epsilon [Candidatus Microgenomates bacterium]|nr:ATP synthase F1 subunit epsilon [Candidatus Microgenomates bacterium]